MSSHPRCPTCGAPATPSLPQSFGPAVPDDFGGEDWIWWRFDLTAALRGRIEALTEHEVFDVLEWAPGYVPGRDLDVFRAALLSVLTGEGK